MRVPWTERISNQSILKEISPEYSLEGLMLKLKLQHFGHLMRRTDSLEKTLMLGKTESKRRRGRQRMRQLESITDSMAMSLSKLQETVKDRSLACCSPWGCKESDTTERVNNNSSVQFSSVRFSRSVVSDSLRPRESQHARPPCPSPALRVGQAGPISHPLHQFFH